MKYKLSALLLVFLLLSTSLGAQEWDFDILPSHSNSIMSEVFPYPFSTIISFSTLAGARNSAQFGIKGGPSFTDHYYFLIPEKETTFFWYTGVNWINKPIYYRNWQSDVPGTYTTIENENYMQTHTTLFLSQVLLGDRYHEDAHLRLSLRHNTGYFSPLDAATQGVPFFLHTPEVMLDIFAVDDDPFWSVFAFKTHVSIPLEIGHLSAADSFEAFLGLSGNMNLKLPVISKYLYLDLDLSSKMLIKNLTPGSTGAMYTFNNYGSRYAFSSQANLKSRFFEFEVIYKMALELAFFATADYETDNPSVDALLSVPIKIGGYGEFKIEVPFIMSMAVKIGMIYDINTKSMGFLLQI